MISGSPVPRPAATSDSGFRRRRRTRATRSLPWIRRGLGIPSFHIGHESGNDDLVIGSPMGSRSSVRPRSLVSGHPHSRIHTAERPDTAAVDPVVRSIFDRFRSVGDESAIDGHVARFPDPRGSAHSTGWCRMSVIVARPVIAFGIRHPRVEPQYRAYDSGRIRSIRGRDGQVGSCSLATGLRGRAVLRGRVRAGQRA